jgi:peptidoglycan/LPS O-acetylase OafA/YrhL
VLATGQHPKPTGSSTAAPVQFSTIDAARGICAAWVFLTHCVALSGIQLRLFITPGFAVDVFMAISGFLMTRHFIERQAKEPWESPTTWLRFWTRRFFRLAPGYYFLLTIAFLLEPLMYGFVENMKAVSTLIIDTSIYSDRSAANIASHYSFVFGLLPAYHWRTPLPDWSLSLEMQFYFTFPFLMLLFWGLGWIAATAILVAASLFVWWLAPSYMESFYLPSMLLLKLPVFLAGMLGAFAIERSQRNYGVLLGAAVLLTLIPLPNSGGWIMDLYRGIYVSALLIAVTLEGGRYRGPLSATGDWLVGISKHRFFAFLADMSYGVYLLHALTVPVVVGWLATQGLDRIPRAAMALAICVPLTYALAWILHKCIEAPGISLGRQLLQWPAKKTAAILAAK